MSLTNRLLGNITARALIIGIAALAAYDVGIHNINPPSTSVHQDNGHDNIGNNRHDIEKYVFECNVGGKWENIKNYGGKWKNDIYGCKMIELPSVKLSPISL